MYTIDPDLLRSLVAFDETGSLARAADRVGRSESAVSLQMKRLEEGFGRAIFARQGRRLALTDDGYMVLHHARRILAMHEELMSFVRRPPMSGRVRIATSQDFGEETLPRILRNLGRQYPKVKFEVQVEGGLHGLEALEKGKVDVVLTVGLSEHPSTHRLRRTRLAWISSPDFQLKGNSIVPLVVFNHPCRFKQRAIELLNEADIRWEIVFQSPSLSGLWAATRAGIGITVRSSYWIPTGLVMQNSEWGGLPNLGETDITIHYYEHALSAELLEIVRYIERSILLDSTHDETFFSAPSGRPDGHAQQGKQVGDTT